MAWIKIPKENHPLFYERLPADKRIQTLQMFGAAAAKANGHLFGGLFAHSFMVKLGPGDHEAALALDGAEPFDPMGDGRVMTNSVLMPETLMDEPDEMRHWLKKAFDYAITLPAKKSKSAAKPGAQKSAAKKPAPKKPAPKKPAPKKPATNKARSPSRAGR